MNKNDLFAYNEMEGDPTKQIILKEEMFYQYDETKPLLLDSTYADLYNSIVTDKSILHSEHSLGTGANIKVIKDSISLWDSLGIKLNDINVINGPFKIEDDGHFTFTQEFLDSIVTAHPSELPIVFNESQEDGKLDAHLDSITIGPFPNEPKNNSILYKEIALSKVNSKLISCMYNHEITHTQLDMVDRSCTNLLNSETIPILMEQIFASKLDSSGETLRKVRNIRLLNLARSLFTCMAVKNIAYVSKIEADTYIKSTLQAIKLANIYLSSGYGIQKEITYYINKIFSEQVSVEEMLNKYESNLEQVSKDIKVLKKV